MWPAQWPRRRAWRCPAPARQSRPGRKAWLMPGSRTRRCVFEGRGGAGLLWRSVAPKVGGQARGRVAGGCSVGGSPAQKEALGHSAMLTVAPPRRWTGQPPDCRRPPSVCAQSRRGAAQPPGQGRTTRSTQSRAITQFLVLQPSKGHIGPTAGRRVQHTQSGGAAARIRQGIPPCR